MGTYPDSYKVEVYCGSWIDISSDIVSSIKGTWGIYGNTPTSLMADAGYLKFTLNNVDGKYSPGLVGSLAGFKTGIQVKLTINFDSLTYIRFKGTIDSLDLVSNAQGNYQVKVSCIDWLGFAARYPLTSPDIQFNKTADSAIQTIIGFMPQQPANSILDAGNETFLTVFDTVKTNTQAYGEMAKLVNSELGYLYLTKDRDFGETLVFESSTARNGLRTLSIIPTSHAVSGHMKCEDDTYLLYENGENIHLNEVKDMEMLDNMTDLQVDYGNNTLNYFNITAYPKKVDTTPVVLYSLTSPLRISSNEQITFRANYTDPAGSGAVVNGFNMINPVYPTDFLMNTISDGSGTDISANLAFSATYGTEGVTYQVVNNSVYTGYITKLQARGYGIYSYAQIDTTVQDVTSINQYGFKKNSIDQKYKQSLTGSVIRSKAFVELDKNPQTTVRQVRFIANTSDDLMQAFLNIDVGSLIHLSETHMGIDENEFVQSVEFEIVQGGIIDVVWRVKQFLSLTLGLSLMSAEIPASSQAIIDYGNLPQLTNLTKQTISAWVYITSASNFMGVAGTFSDYACSLMYVSNHSVGYLTKMTGQQGLWYSDLGLTYNTWAMITVTRDITSSPLENPLMYINGSSVTVNISNAPVGSKHDETGIPFFIGNLKSPAYDYSWPFGGLIKDVRMYNRVLTSTEITDLYNGIPVTDGLVFQGPCIKTSEATTLDGQTLTIDNKVLDNINQMVGTAIGVVAHIP